MIKILVYIFLFLYLTNPAVIFIIGNLLVHGGNDIFLTLVSIPLVGFYTKYVWFPFRQKYKTIDDEAIKYLR